MLARRGLAALVAVWAALGLAAGSASGNGLSVDDQDFEIAWSSVSTQPWFEVQCPVTLAGSFHRSTIGKGPNALVGAITSADVDTEECLGGIMAFLAGTLPARVHYQSFSGSLPAITGVRLSIVGLAFSLENEAWHCLATTSEAEPLPVDLTLAAGVVTAARLDEEWAIDLNDTTWSLCDLTGMFTALGGTGTVDDASSETVALSLF